MKLKLKMSMNILATTKKCLTLVIIMIIQDILSKYYDNSNKLVAGKMKEETAGVAIEEFFGLKPKIY